MLDFQATLCGHGGWKGVQGPFLGALETVCLLIWALVTLACSACENYQPVNLGFVHSSVCVLYFNNNSFLKSR